MSTRKTPPEAVEEFHRIEAAYEPLQETLARHCWHWTLDTSNPDKVSLRQFAKDIKRDLKSVRPMARGYARFVAQGEGNIPLTLGECILREAMSAGRELATDALVKVSKGITEVNGGKGWTFTTARQKSELIKAVVTKATELAEDVIPTPDEMETAAAYVITDYAESLSAPVPEPEPMPAADDVVPDTVPDDIMDLPTPPDPDVTDEDSDSDPKTRKLVDPRKARRKRFVMPTDPALKAGIAKMADEAKRRKAMKSADADDYDTDLSMALSDIFARAEYMNLNPAGVSAIPDRYLTDYIDGYNEAIDMLVAQRDRLVAEQILRRDSPPSKELEDVLDDILRTGE